MTLNNGAAFLSAIRVFQQGLGGGALFTGIVRICRPDSTSYGRQQHRKRAHALRAEDQNAFDICRRGRSAVEDRIGIVTKFGASIGIVEVYKDLLWIEQHDKVLGKIGESIDLEIAVGE